jgi:hypothetical protein
MIMKKTHYIHGCSKGKHRSSYGWNIGEAVNDMSKVDCKDCLNVITRKRLKPRDAFPDCPTFVVTAEGRWKAEGHPDGCHLVFNCPVCGRKIAHGGYFENVGGGDGLRSSHCNCWEKGYYIREKAVTYS